MEWTDRLAEQRIREAQARGDFDDLPMAGKPLDLGDPDDADWWLKRYLKDNGVSAADVLPAPLALRREAQSWPESLLDVANEATVREILTEHNVRVRRSWLEPAFAPLPPARLVDVDDMVRRWAAARARRGQQ